MIPERTPADNVSQGTIPCTILYVDTEEVWRGGQEQLLGLMVGMKAKGHRVMLAAPGNAPLSSRAAEQGIQLLDHDQRMEFSPLAAARLLRILNHERINVLHFNTPRALLAGGVAALLAGTPVVVCSRRVNFPLSSRFSALKYNHFLDKVLTVSVSIRRTLIEGGVSGGIIEVVYEGVDIDWIDRQVTSGFKCPSKGPIVGTVAHLSGEKGHAPLIKAAALLKDRFPDAHFVIVGDGPLRGELQAQVAELGLGRAVTFSGFRSDSEAVMKHFDVFCLPSLSEGLSSAILAAMATRLPVVSTRVGGIPELVEDGRTGYLVEPDDPARLAEALGQLLESEVLRGQMGEAGRSRIEQHFTLERKLDNTERVYTKLLRLKGFR